MNLVYMENWTVNVFQKIPPELVNKGICHRNRNRHYDLNKTKAMMKRFSAAEEAGLGKLAEESKSFSMRVDTS